MTTLSEAARAHGYVTAMEAMSGGRTWHVTFSDAPARLFTMERETGVWVSEPVLPAPPAHCRRGEHAWTWKADQGDAQACDDCGTDRPAGV